MQSRKYYLRKFTNTLWGITQILMVITGILILYRLCGPKEVTDYTSISAGYDLVFGSEYLISRFAVILNNVCLLNNMIASIGYVSLVNIDKIKITIEKLLINLLFIHNIHYVYERLALTSIR